MSWVFHPEVIALGLASLTLILVLTLAVTAGVRYQLSYDRLPAATRNRELEVLIGGNEARLHELREEIKRAEVTLSERDQAEAEAEFWRSSVETAKAEYANLADQRREVEELREEYRQALEELTLAETQLRERKADAELAQTQFRDAEESVRRVKEEEEALRRSQTELREAVAEAERRLSEFREERASLGVEVERLRDRRGSLEADCEALTSEVASRTTRKAEAEAELSRLKQAIDTLPAKQAEIDEMERMLQLLASKREALEQSVETLERAEGRLRARIAKLEEESGGVNGAGGASVDDHALDDLTKPPACFAVEGANSEIEPVLPNAQAAVQETDVLQRVMRHLRESGFEFPDRTVSAFHTSLKTAVISPLTVLAGISGTGKSQLPRYYADAMGIHFLKIPVQPRWDSPQDLFGFYNYIEKRYKATDLARALVHLDPHNWQELAAPYKDRMLMVLLDEMNLARVEYYFSEFLSRLEGRPLDEDAASDADRRTSEIDIDVSRKGQTKRVLAGQNVLFVGTMNEDESTLALSDKVLDRANVLRFPKPLKLKNALLKPDERYVADGYLKKERWTKGWIKEAASLSDSQHSRATEIVAKINNAMNDLGRPFGHRMGQAMLHYVANYPVPPNQTNNTGQVGWGMADQIEQRIMPRLRGVLAQENSRPLRDLADIAGRELGDGPLAEEIERCLDRSRETNGLFVWRGFTRSS